MDPMEEAFRQEYDAIVFGTGLTECIISGLLSVSGKKVLHIDRNPYYGGQSTSLNLNQLWERFRPGQPVPPNLGPSREWAVDMVPKFIMANGKLVQAFVKTNVHDKLQFKAVDGSFVFSKGKVHKVPATDFEALRSPLMGIFEKRRARSFFIYVQDYDEKNSTTHKGWDLRRKTMADLYKEFGLDAQTQDFIGHALALHQNDDYLTQPALPTVEKIKLYHDSLTRFEGLKSPYIYPLYGLGDLPQAFARLSAVHGGTYMLNKSDAEPVFDESGKACGLRCEGRVAKCKIVVGDPSYFAGRTRPLYRVVRAICILSHPIPNTNDGHSVQIIVPQKQLGRRHDMYIFCSSYMHNVAPNGKWLAFVSTTVETNNPETELQQGFALLGPIDEKFIEVTEVHEPLDDGRANGAFISRGYDATSHFETVMDDVCDLYKRITGEELDLTETPTTAES